MEIVSAETIKQRYGNPFEGVLQALERATAQGFDALSEDDLFMCKWLGLYTHRHEKGYFMLRTKQPNGFITPDQLEAIADIAEKQNKGFADITTRQDFQLHWIHYADAVGILKRLESVGVSVKGACGDILRNVVGCPVAGVDRTEAFDASPIAQQISDFFLGNVEYANLPRKYKISVSGCREQCVHPEIQCVSLVGMERKVSASGGGGITEVGFDLHVGGGLSTQPFLSQRLNAFVKPDDALEVVKAITDIWRETPEYRQKRHHARLKYLIHDWGIEKFRQALEQRLGRKLDEAPSDHRDPHEMYRDHVGVHAQKQAGLYYIGAPVLVGRITSRQMKAVAEMCRRYGDSRTIRLTNRQNIVLLNVSETNVSKVLEGLTNVGLSINAHPIRRSVVTCTGIEFCKLAITETKARSREIVEHLERRVHLDEPLRLHITGCPNACAQYQIAHIGLMGSKTKVDGQIVDAYDILIGGQVGHEARFGHAVIRKVPAAECKHRLEALLVAFTKQRQPGEPFNAWSQRVGDAKLVEILSPAKGKAQEADGVDVPQVPEADGPVY